MYRHGKKSQKFIAGILALQMAGSLLFPAPAQAQFATLSTVVGDWVQLAAEAAKVALKQVGIAAQVTLVEVSTYMGQKIAYDMAVQLVAGGSGQKPLFSARDGFNYFKDEIVLDGLAQTLSSFSQNLTKYDICTFDPRMALQLQLGFAQTVRPTSRRCDFRQLTARFNAIKDEASSFAANPQESFAARFSVQFEPGNNTLDGTLRAISGLRQEMKETKEAEIQQEFLDRIGSLKPVKDVVTQQVTTPKEIVTETAAEKLVREPIRDVRDVKDAALKAPAEDITKIILLTTKTFAATLLGEVSKKIFQGLATPSKQDVANPFAPSGAGLAEARQSLSGIVPAVASTISNYDVTANFASCPAVTNPNLTRHPDTCVMDIQFAAAVRRGATSDVLTVQEALQQGFLKGNWELIGPNDPRNKQPDCFQNAFCYSNLVKLRRARIIPVGWELAAILAEAERPGTTLKEVMDSFDCGSNDLQSFCKLIDPNWILKYPVTQCRQMVNGQTLLSQQTPTRHEICVDTPSCVQEDGKGGCLGTYGYCTQEKNVWRFEGDVCEKEMASCLTVSRPDNSQISLLTNTLQGGVCNAGNAGCAQYLLDKDAVSPTAATASMFLTSQAEKCAATDKGCTELVDLTGTRGSFTMLRNGSFNTLAATNAPAHWENIRIQDVRTGSLSMEGANSVFLSDETNPTQAVMLQANTPYTLSFDAKWQGAARDVRVDFVFYNISGATPTPVTYPANIQLDGAGWTRNNNILTWQQSVSAGQSNPTPERKVLRFLAPNQPTFMVLALSSPAATDAQGVVIDQVMLEEFKEEASAFTETYVAGSKVMMKMAPEVLNCKGDATDDARCREYAGACKAGDVGCEKYTPANGEPVVNGAVTSIDFCPAVCSGYDTFKQLGYEESQYGSKFEASVFPVHLIPRTAQTCSLQYAGCDEFTNLEALARGGESKEHYTELRMCQVITAGDDTRTYYTWEGTESAGVQLRTWRLKSSNQNPAVPCTNARWENGALVCRDEQNAPDTLCDEAADLAVNLDCREFYDDQGARSYRRMSKTIIASETCTQLRKTAPQGATAQERAQICGNTGGNWNGTTGDCTYSAYIPLSRMCPAAQNGCRAYRGNTGANTRLVFTETFDNVPAGINNAPGWSGQISAETLAAGGKSLRSSTGSVSSASGSTYPLAQVLQSGKTYQVTFWYKAASAGAQVSVGFMDGATTSPLKQLDNSDAVKTISAPTTEWTRIVVDAMSLRATNAQTYLWIAGSAVDTFYVDTVEVREVQSVAAYIKGSSQIPAACDQTPEGTASPQEMLGCKEYRDRAGQPRYLRSFSRQCPEGAVGCKAFAVTGDNQSQYQEVFNARCYKQGGGDCSITLLSGNTVKACTIQPNQQFCRFNSSDLPVQTTLFLRDIPATPPAAATFPVRAPDTVVVKGDYVKYLIDDPSKRCSESAKGCYEFGKTQWNAAQDAITGASAAYFKNDPSKYVTSLCTQEANFCEAFKAADNSTRFFKDPSPADANGQRGTAKLCEFRDEVVIGTDRFSGWFQKGTNTPCYPDQLIGGNFYGLLKNGDVGYQGWVGACPAAQSSCTEFIDTTDTTAANSTGKSYFFLKNARVLSNTCTQASRRDGCVLFNDTSDTQKRYSAEATYAASDAQGGNAVSPISCPAGSTDPQCQVSCIDGEPGCANGKKSLTSDSNLLLRVRRDRECAAWYTPTSSFPVVNPATQETKDVTNQIRLCTGLNAADGDQALCASFAQTQNQVLTMSEYQARDISWKAGDLSGYTVPGMYPLDRLTQVNVAGKCVITAGNVVTQKSCLSNAQCSTGETCRPDPTEFDLRLAVRLGSCQNLPNGSVCSAGACSNNPQRSCTVAPDCPRTSPTGPAPTCDFAQAKQGNCYDNACVQSAGNALDVFTPTLSFDVNGRPPEQLACRAYPADDSPVSAAVVTDWRRTVQSGDEFKDADAASRIVSETMQWQPAQVQQNFRGANICALVRDPQTGAVTEQCECRYVKAEYGQKEITKYLPQAIKTRMKPYVCSGGPNAGAACTPPLNSTEEDMCGTAGRCVPLTKVEQAVGMEGYCIARDLSVPVNGSAQEYACAQWLPVDALPGSIDIFNQFDTAAFVPKEDELFYCAESAGFSKPNGNNTFTASSLVVVNELANGGLICQDAAQSCASRLNKTSCESAYCKWDGSSCKTYLVNNPEPPSIPAQPPGCGTSAPETRCAVSNITTPAPTLQNPGNTNTCRSPYVDKDNDGNSDIGEPVFNDNTCCVDDDSNLCAGQGVVPKCGTTKAACLTPEIVPPSTDWLADSCADLDKAIVGGATSILVGFGAYGPVGAAVVAPFGGSVAGIAAAKCYELSQSSVGVCGFAQKGSRFMFSAINNPFALSTDQLSGFAGDAANALTGFPVHGGTGVRMSRVLNPGPNDVPLYQDALGMRKDVRKDQIAAIKVTVTDSDPQTAAVPRTFFLLPPYFEASFWWNGGDQQDSYRTQDGKALAFNDYDTKCGENGINCRDEARGKTCENFFPDTLPQNYNGPDLGCSGLQPQINQENKNIENCAAIQTQFSSAGVFDGFKSGMCIRSNTHGGKLPVKVEVLLKETCETITQVATQSPTSLVASAAAYTDKIWEKKKQEIAGQGGTTLPNLTPGYTTAAQDPFYPYGGINARGFDLREDLLNQAVGLYFKKDTIGEPPFPAFKGATSVGPVAVSVARDNSQPAGGYSFGIKAGGDNSALTPRGDNSDLREIFAMSFGNYGWQRSSTLDGGAYTAVVAGKWDDRTPTANTTMHEPLIYPIRAGTCRPTDGRCQADLARKNQITVNDVNEGTLRGAGTMKASVKFYFEVDKDHMPAKRIVIDWGDGTDATDITSTYGLYKNYVGLKADGTRGCDESNFGRSSGACDDNFIQFTHTYVCDENTFNAATSVAGDINLGKPVKDEARGTCSFKPRVMVLDNWGWCNGVCSGSPNDLVAQSPICFAEARNLAGVRQDQCKPEIDTQDPSDLDALDARYPQYNPWAPFAGTIEISR